MKPHQEIFLLSKKVEINIKPLVLPKMAQAKKKYTNASKKNKQPTNNSLKQNTV